MSHRKLQGTSLKCARVCLTCGETDIGGHILQVRVNAARVLVACACARSCICPHHL
jgi:hypothetical protein